MRLATLVGLGRAPVSVGGGLGALLGFFGLLVGVECCAECRLGALSGAAVALLGVVADLDRLLHGGSFPAAASPGIPRPVGGDGGAVGLFLQLVGALLLAGDPVGLHYGGGAGAVVEVERHSEAGRAQRVGGPLDAGPVGALVAGPRQVPGAPGFGPSATAASSRSRRIRPRGWCPTRRFLLLRCAR